MLDLNALVQLLAAMKANDIAEMVITHDRVEIRSNAAVGQAVRSAAPVLVGAAAEPDAAVAQGGGKAALATPSAAGSPDGAAAVGTAPVTATAGAGPARETVVIRAPLPGVVHCHPARGPKGAPLPGVGDPVSARGVALLVEAMKMNNEVLTPKAGVVRELRVQHGQKVKAGQVLMELEVDA